MTNELDPKFSSSIFTKKELIKNYKFIEINSIMISMTDGEDNKKIKFIWTLSHFKSNHYREMIFAKYSAKY